jgi:hypothetical protein
MICPVRLANELSASGRGRREFMLMTRAQHEALFGSGRGTDDESPKGDLTGTFLRLADINPKTTAYSRHSKNRMPRLPGTSGL